MLIENSYLKMPIRPKIKVLLNKNVFNLFKKFEMSTRLIVIN